MKASDLLVECLEREGIEYVFGVPGEENADFLLSLDQSDQIRFVLTRHEQGAAFMADAYGRLTGNPAVALGTLGPGATNLVTGVANANMDRSPMIVLTGQGDVQLHHKESHQIMDVVGMFAPITKWAHSIKHPDTIPEVVRKAVRLCRTEKPGAVHLELSEDVAKLPTQARPLQPRRFRRPAADEKALSDAVKLLKSSHRPVIIAGNGTIRRRASSQLRRLCEKTGVGVVSTFMAKGCVDMDADYCLYSIGLQQHDQLSLHVANSDQVITIGYDMAEYPPRLWNDHGRKPIIHIDFVPAEIDAHYHPEVEVVGDIGQILAALSERLEVEGCPTIDLARQQETRRIMQADFAEYRDDDTAGRDPSSESAVGRPAAIGRGRLAAVRRWCPQDVGRPILPLPSTEHLPDFQWLLLDGDAASRLDCRTSGESRPTSHGDHGRRRLPDERPGNGDGPAAERQHHHHGLGGPRLRPDQLEAGGGVRTARRHDVRQPELGAAGRRLRLAMPGRGTFTRFGSGDSGRPGTRRTVAHRCSHRLSGELPSDRKAGRVLQPHLMYPGAFDMLRQEYPFYLANQPHQPNSDLEVEDKYTGKPAARVARADAEVLEPGDRQGVGSRRADAQDARLPAAGGVASPRGSLQGAGRRIGRRSLCRGGQADPARPRRSHSLDRHATNGRRRGGTDLRRSDAPGCLAAPSGYQGMWKRVPIGPCAFITPWNFPLNLVAHKIAPALACGCPFVLKPASATPIGALILGEMLAETDLPEGAFSILPMASSDASALVEDERIRKLSFTGSADVGWALRDRARKKRVTLELGGNAACVVDEDADIDDAVSRCVFGGYYQSGQSCISVQRLLVHESIYVAFRDKFVRAVRELIMGDPKQEETFVGPIISEEDARRIENWIEAAVAAGGKPLCGGCRDGRMMEATVLEDVPKDAKVYCEEVFGPVTILARFRISPMPWPR